MNKVAAAFFFALLSIAFVSGARTRRALVQLGTLRRHSSAYAKSTSSSRAVSSGDVEAIVVKAFANAEADGANADTITRTAAKELGTLYAEAWSQAEGVVEVVGGGVATATAAASAEATAQMFARALAGAVATAVNGRGFAGEQVIVEDVATAIIKATSTAVVELKSTGTGFSEATASSVSSAVADVMVTAIADAIAFTANGDVSAETKADTTIDLNIREQTGDATAWLEGESDAETTQFGTTGKPYAYPAPLDNTGDAGLSTKKVADTLPPCRGEAFACCFFEKFCEDHSKVDGRSVQNDKSGELCEC